MSLFVRCAEAIQHGPPDRAGRCPWCRQKTDLPVLRQRPVKYGPEWPWERERHGTDPDIDPKEDR